MEISEYRGNWALVTGASSGIGREFATQFAHAGMNVVLVARRQNLLSSLAAELTERNRVQTRVIVQDLSRPSAAADIRTRLASEGITIRLLCNNAAFGRWGRFEMASPDVYHEMIQVNIGALVALCRCFLADLTTFPSSAIINVSSAAAYQPVPYMATYAATKAFVLSFGQALHGECKGRGVIVQTLVPGPTATEFDAIAGAYASALTKRTAAAQVVQDSLEQLRKEGPVALSAKGTFMQRVFAGLFPPRVVIREVAKRFVPPDG